MAKSRHATTGHPLDLKGHVAIVTGGSQGIGLGLAGGLVKAGADVALWARRKQPLLSAAEHLCELGNSDISTVVCDVACEESVVRAIEETVARFDRIDSLFANAGVVRSKAFIESSIEDYRHQNAVNFEGMFLCFREAAKQMIAQGQGGKLIAVSSIASIVGWSKMVSYSASKGAIGAAVRALAVELGPHNIQVNALLPGVFKTPMTADLGDLDAHYEGYLPSGFVGEPKHAEGVAAFLASSASDYLTGAAIPLDGGLTIAAP